MNLKSTPDRTHSEDLAGLRSPPAVGSVRSENRTGLRFLEVAPARLEPVTLCLEGSWAPVDSRSPDHRVGTETGTACPELGEGSSERTEPLRIRGARSRQRRGIRKSVGIRQIALLQKQYSSRNVQDFTAHDPK